MTPTPLCRAVLPSAVHTNGPRTIDCSKRMQCQRYTALLDGVDGPAVDWACDRNSFDQFVPVQPMVRG